MSDKCLVCSRITSIQNNTNPYFVTELETGYVVIGDYQYFKGYTLLLCKQHKTELHQLNRSFRLKFLEEMSKVAKAVYIAFEPKKLNYELLGNTDAHLHWHIFPRYDTDLSPNTVTWKIDENIRCSNKAKPNGKELNSTKEKLFRALKDTTSNMQ